MTETGHDETEGWRMLLAARVATDRGEPFTNSGPSSPMWDLFHTLATTPRGSRFVVAHLGQSLDGRIATESGHSHYIGCPESIVHLHRLRALCDAVIVGVGTVVADAPQLTTRHVEGPNATRVVLDPKARLDATASLAADRQAPTIVVHASAARPNLPAEVETVALEPWADGALHAGDVLEALAARGLTRILVEGGGRTVSRFLADRAVDRLQLAVAPLIIGSGRPSITLPEVDTLHEALRPPCRRFDLGADTLFEFDLKTNRRADDG